METTPHLFGQLPSGEKVYELTIQNPQGFRVGILTFGGAITAIYAKNAKGHRENVVLCYETLEDYLVNPPYLGVTVGRTAGRIKNGQFDLDGKGIQLENSINPSALHGGIHGLHRVNWSIEDHREDQATLIYVDEAGEGKTPGTLTIEAQYQVLEEDTLVITYRAMTDEKTYVNVANHSYFNLSGKPDQTILNHHLKMTAYDYAPVDVDSVPLEDTKTVIGSPFDFTEGTVLNIAVLADHEQIKRCKGIDHPFELSRAPEQIILEDPVSGRRMAVSTDQPYVIVYSGNFLAEATVPSGKTFPKHGGICFETQDVPDAPNRKDFKGKWLEPGEVYRHETEYTFSLCENE
jgi:aldose 1-epimerase